MTATAVISNASSNAVKYLEQGLQNLKNAAIVVNKDTTLEASTSAFSKSSTWFKSNMFSNFLDICFS